MTAGSTGMGGPGSSPVVQAPAAPTARAAANRRVSAGGLRPTALDRGGSKGPFEGPFLGRPRAARRSLAAIHPAGNVELLPSRPERLRLLAHPRLQRLVGAEPLLGGVVAHVLRDLHGA